MKSQIAILGLVLTTASLAQAQQPPNELPGHYTPAAFRKNAQTAAPSEEKVITFAIRLANILSAWNSQVDASKTAKELLERAHLMGVKKGLIEPALAMVDASLISGRPEFAQQVMSGLFVISPRATMSLADALNSIAAFKPKDKPDDRIIILGKVYDPTQRENDEIIGAPRPARAQRIEIQKSDMVGLLDSFEKRDGFRLGHSGVDFDSSINRKFKPFVKSDSLAMPKLDDALGSISGAIFGKKSGFKFAMPDETPLAKFGVGKRSPIYGLSMDDVRQCFSRCKNAAKENGTSGAVAFGTAGTLAGGLIGATAGGAAGAVGTAGIGIAAGGWVGAAAGTAVLGALGTAGGGAVGYGAGLAVCAVRKCGDQPNVPTSESPTPAAPESPATPEPLKDVDHPPAPTKPDQPTKPEGGDDKCKDKECENGMVIPDYDNGDGGTPNDTGHSRPASIFEAGSPTTSWRRTSVVNPKRDVGFRMDLRSAGKSSRFGGGK